MLYHSERYDPIELAIRKRRVCRVLAKPRSNSGQTPRTVSTVSGQDLKARYVPPLVVKILDDPPGAAAGLQHPALARNVLLDESSESSFSQVASISKRSSPRQEKRHRSFSPPNYRNAVMLNLIQHLP